MSNASNIGKPDSPPAAPSRREFLANLIMTVGGACGLGALAFRFAQYLYPVVPPAHWVEVFASKLAEIPENGVRLVNLQEGPVILEKVGQEVRALSAICTHLGCIVQWHPGRREFICPCHHGTYTFNGTVVSGPPPRPLHKLVATTRNDEVFVRMKSQKEERV